MGSVAGAVGLAWLTVRVQTLGLSCGDPASVFIWGMSSSWTSSEGWGEIWVDGNLQGQGLGKDVERSCLHSYVPKRADGAHTCVSVCTCTFAVIRDTSVNPLRAPPTRPRKEHVFSVPNLGNELGTSAIQSMQRQNSVSFLEKVFHSLPFNRISVCSRGRVAFCLQLSVLKFDIPRGVAPWNPLHTLMWVWVVRNDLRCPSHTSGRWGVEDEPLLLGFTPAVWHRGWGSGGVGRCMEWPG